MCTTCTTHSIPDTDADIIRHDDGRVEIRIEDKSVFLKSSIWDFLRKVV